MASQVQHPNLPLPDYFSKFGSVYVCQTGHSTLDILANIVAEYVQASNHPIGPESVVHDTAAALVACLAKDQLPRKVLVSDNVAMMVSAARESLVASPLPHVECKELDSQDLSSIPDNYFTHSIDNFSIFTFTRPADAVRESYRTLRPGGLAVVTCWRRPEFYKEGTLQKAAEESGFARENITMVDKVLIVTDDENIAGLTMLMSGPMMGKAREGYTEEEQAKWAESISQSVKEEVEQFGGIRFEAYVLLATKDRGLNVPAPDEGEA